MFGSASIFSSLIVWCQAVRIIITTIDDITGIKYVGPRVRTKCKKYGMLYIDLLVAYWVTLYLT